MAENIFYNLENALLYPSRRSVDIMFREYKDALYDSSQYDFKEIYPKVFIYRNLFTNPDKITKILQDAVTDPDSSYFFKDWAQWGGIDSPTIFGQYVLSLGEGFDKGINTLAEHNKAVEELEVVAEVIKSFFAATNHYMKYWNIEPSDDWNHTPPSFCRYIPTDAIPDNKLFMQFHTDYQIQLAEEPGDKFVITTTMYFNDDYRGGEIVFKVKDDLFSYKPEAGDLLVFPSGHPSILMEGEDPIMHAVNPVPVGDPDRYIVRMFHRVYSDGDNVQEMIAKNILQGAKFERDEGDTDDK